MSASAYEVSDGISNMRRQLADFENCGLQMDGEDVCELRRQLKELLIAARRLENEISRHRWNEQGRCDRDQETLDVVAEISRPGSNVTLFPVIHRPFCDGGPEGARP